MYFLRQIIFILRLKNKIMFSEKRNIINLDDIRKVIFQCDFCGKTIFSEYLEKENMAFRAVPIACKIISFFNISLIFSYILNASKTIFFSFILFSRDMTHLPVYDFVTGMNNTTFDIMKIF